jgi:hypothetical protein
VAFAAPAPAGFSLAACVVAWRYASRTLRPDDLGHMRRNGVRSLAVYCGAIDCHHAAVLNVERYPDDVPVPAFGPRMRCIACGHLGADARPNWADPRR